jgi:hypothetical protein
MMPSSAQHYTCRQLPHERCLTSAKFSPAAFMEGREATKAPDACAEKRNVAWMLTTGLIYIAMSSVK